jgi:hypothetical protein
MSIFSKIFRKGGKDQETKVGGMEDFMLLIRVYYQAVMAAQIGINNLGALPDLRIFKQTYRVATVNNKLGIAEKKHCRKLMQDIYGISDGFFTEIDSSIRKHCHKIQDAQSYLIQFQGFSQDLMMLMGNLMQWKMRLPSFFRGALREMTAKQVHQVMTKNDWKDEGVRRACVSVRKYQNVLGYTEQWMTEYVHTIVMLAKKEPNKNSEQ